MGTTVFAMKTHDNQVWEMGDASLAHFHLSWHHADMAFEVKDTSLLVHEVLLQRLIEVNCFKLRFFLLLFFLHFSLYFCIILAVAHFLYLLKCSWHIADQNSMIQFWGKWILDIRISAWVLDFYIHGQFLSISHLL